MDSIDTKVLCYKQVQQLEKKLREGTDYNQSSAQPVRGKWNTANNPHEERYQSKLQDLQKERRAATEVSRAFLTLLRCAMRSKPSRHTTSEIQTGLSKGP